MVLYRNLWRFNLESKDGVTLIELLVIIALIGVISVLVAPEIGRFNSNYRVRSCATDLVQNMRAARAMAIKENRDYLIVFDPTNQRYLIGSDQDNDNNLITVSTANNGDTYGPCKDTDGDRIPDSDTDTNGDGVPDCIRVENLRNMGSILSY